MPIKNVAHLSFLCLIFVSLVLVGCTPHAYNKGIASSGPPPARPNLSSGKLMLFGGEDHMTYLGCLNCSEFTSDSVFNKYGAHGSAYASESIWNHYSEYGSSYSNEGACNPYATDPPVIVDSEGKFYGRLTANAYHHQLGSGSEYREWLLGEVCQRD